MDDTKRRWVQSWLLKAHSDLRSARALAALPEPATDTAVYHCQQAAEKALKAYLAFRDQPLERTHDLEHLLELAARIDPTFAPLEPQAGDLNPYAAAFRYPGELDVLFPPITEVLAAIQDAQAMYDSVLKRIPPEAHPTQDNP